MDNPKYIQVMRQVASDFDGISHELFQVASDLERMDQYNPQQKLFSLVRSAEVSSVTLRNLTARTVRDDTAPFYCEVADLLGIKVEETHDWLKISVPAILPKRNQRDNQAFLTRPLRYAIMDYLKENPMERFGSCAICIVHNYDAVSELMAEAVINRDYQRFIKNVTRISKGYSKGIKAIKKAGHMLADYGLTVRESDVAKLAAKRYSNKEIAEHLFIAESTVKSNMKVIFNKLQINSRAELKNFFE